MKQSINKLFIIIFMIFSYIAFIPICKADECDTNRLKELAKMVDVTSEIDYDSVSLGIFGANIVTISGLSEELFAITDDGSVGFYFDEGEVGSVIRRVDSGVEKIKIYSVKCPDTLLRTIDLTLKQYNPFSTYTECNGLEDKIDVCFEYLDKNITYEEFIKQINKYKNDNNINSKVDETEDNILDILKENLVLVVIAGFVIIGVVVFFIVYRAKKKRLD